ncbi:MAG TPA: acyltransferase family protein [Luteimonas sp.]
MTRRHDLDWVRVCAFGLLVLYHVGMYYVSWDWHVKSPSAGPTIEPLMFLTSPWRLSLLFLVSGAATALALERAAHGGTTGAPPRFLGLRSRRLLVPLVFGMLVVVPPQAYYEVLGSGYPGGYDEGYLAFWGRYLAADDSFCDADGCLDLPTWNHLWFVAYLWVYTLALWLLLRFAPAMVASCRARLTRLLAGGGLLLVPIIFLALARVSLVAVFESTHALTDDWYNHVQYFAMFALGFALASAAAPWDRIVAMRWPALGLAVASWAFLAWYFNHYVADAPPPAVRMLQRVAWAVNQWTAIVAVLGFARYAAPGDSPLLRYLSGAVFTVYILHQTVIVVMSQALRPLGLQPLAEGMLLVATTLAASFTGYELARRIPLLGALLGARSPRARARRWTWPGRPRLPEA